ncbi:MAG: acetylglutamate kinase [Bacteroidaceae bacterium]|nr:acetylglutamate kinase [Bacteroidaceae bacterium]
MALTVVKIGGNVIDHPSMLSQFVKDFSQLPSPKILVHGGGKIATELCKKLGIETQMIEGRRVTDRETLDVVTMVYGGLINKNVVAQLQSVQCNAIGLTGADAGILPAMRRAPRPIDYGYVGDIKIDEVRSETVKLFLEAGIVPVFCALTHDEQGSVLNSNADSVASAVAVAMSKLYEVELVYCLELPGVMQDIDNPESMIEEIDQASYVRLKDEGIVNKGMIPKIDNAFSAIRQGVSRVIIKHAKNLTNNTGTTIK